MLCGVRQHRSVVRWQPYARHSGRAVWVAQDGASRAHPPLQVPPLRPRMPGQSAFRQRQLPLFPPFRTVRGRASQGVYGKVRCCPVAGKLGHGQAHPQGVPAPPVLPAAAQGRARHRHRRVLGAARRRVPHDSGRP